MGRNSRARRESRRRFDQPAPAAGPFVRPGPMLDAGPDPRARDDLAVAERLVLEALGLLLRGRPTAADVRRRADALISRSHPLPLVTVDDALHAVLTRLADRLPGAGWSPDDLREITVRWLGSDHLPLLAWLLAVDAARGPEPSAAWGAQLDALGTGTRTVPAGPDSVTRVLGLAALLSNLPDLPVVLSRSGPGPRRATPEPSGGPTPTPTPEATAELGRKLATVRALLAKAESTTFEQEADALTAKAQELIGRYSLDRLLEESSGAGPRAAGIEATRIWLESPYADAKATLVHHVAIANRCQAVFSSGLGCCTVVGAVADLASVELLTTSLLVQAARAMMRHGAQVDSYGVTRTKSFRATFLLSFAVRIGQRLIESTERAVADHAEQGLLLPALVDQGERVQAAFDDLVGVTTTRARRISNGAGWQAGVEAADRARLGERRPLTGEGR